MTNVPLVQIDIDDLTPEEDIVPLGQVMTSALFPTAFYLPSYINWLKSNEAALTGSVKYLKQYLDRHLRFDNRPWVLVCFSLFSCAYFALLSLTSGIKKWAENSLAPGAFERRQQRVQKRTLCVDASQSIKVHVFNVKPGAVSNWHELGLASEFFICGFGRQ